MRDPVFDRRRGGVLLSMSSLPRALGAGGRAFIDWLADAGFSVWQLLPVGPPGADGSPYWVRSDYAGNPAFIDADELPEDAAEYTAFCAAAAGWLEDYALFEALSAAHGGRPFWEWPAPLAAREAAAVAQFANAAAATLDGIRRSQFAFAVQWRRLREHARQRGVRLFGDLPFYVAPDSAEVWAHREAFQLEPDGRPRAVAGVPPDYFSSTGQLWGNPLYDWASIERHDFGLWRGRVGSQLERFDVVRIDHFRALAAHWAVPATAPDARTGSWQPTPGSVLLEQLRAELGDLPVVAEDLGIITADVVELRQRFGLPGMRVLQFAFDGAPDNPHLPYMHERDCVIYTGTHDNDTSVGWYRTLDPGTRERVQALLDPVGTSPSPEPLVRAALGSVGRLAVIPMQDLLALGSDARLNTPGTVGANWGWQLPEGALSGELAARCAALCRTFGRSP